MVRGHESAPDAVDGSRQRHCDGRNCGVIRKAVNVSYWLDSEVAVSLINVRLYEAFAVKVVVVLVA